MTETPDYFLKSKRLGFRTWQAGDLELALNLWGDFEVTKYFDTRGKLDDKDVYKKLEEEITRQEEHNVQYWPIFLLENSKHVGCCGLRPYDQKNNIYELGFHICSKDWRKGYATEAAKATIDYAFNKLKISALFAGHHPENKTSEDLLLKLGFEYTHDEFYEPTGREHPSYLLKSNIN